MATIDLRKQLKTLYNPSAQAVSIVDVPELRFLMIDGSGDPNTAPEYTQAVEALYGLAYALKFTLKKGPAAIDYTVMPLEGLWWADDMRLFSVSDKGAWRWTMMILQPDAITPELFERTLAEVQRKKQLPALARLRLESYHEGQAAQIMHIGPYATEGPTVAKLHAYISEHEHHLSGKHHEIYLSDPRKSAPEKMRTIIRQPFGVL